MLRFNPRIFKNLDGFSVTVELNPTMQQFLLYSKIWFSKDNAIIWSISLIQPRQLATVISALAMAIRSMRVSRVKTTPSERIGVFHLLKSDSIGFNTGLYAGRKTNVWLNLCAQLATTAQWWNLDCPWWSSKNHGLLRTNFGIALQERSRNAHLCTRQDECVHRETPLAHCGTYRESHSVTVCDNNTRSLSPTWSTKFPPQVQVKTAFIYPDGMPAVGWCFTQNTLHLLPPC